MSGANIRESLGRSSDRVAQRIKAAAVSQPVVIRQPECRNMPLAWSNGATDNRTGREERQVKEQKTLWKHELRRRGAISRPRSLKSAGRIRNLKSR